MKNMILNILLIGVLFIGFTGCGNEKKDDFNSNIKIDSSNIYVMICSYQQEADNEYEPVTNSIEEYIYDDDNILKTLVIKDEYEYSSKDLAEKYRNSEEKYVERANTYSGIKAEVNKLSDTKFTVNYEYDIDKVDSNLLFNSYSYLDSNNVFSVDEYKAYYESLHKNRNGKCIITEK